jgi:hypothetical protein
MKMKTRRHDVDDDDADEMVRDGERVRCPMYLMDSMQRRIAFDAASHQPGYRSVDSATVRDARRMARDAREEMIRRLTDAWRTPVRDAAEPDASERLLRRHLGNERPDEKPDDDAQARRDRQWAEYCDRVSNAWRSPGGTAAPEAHGRLWRAEPSHSAGAIERQREQWTAER